MRTSRRPITLRFDLWELTLILTFLVAVILVTVVWLASRLAEPVDPPQSARERVFFETKYGPSHNSQREEEWLIRDYFGGRRGGVFLDVGANHYKKYSKTYYLESELGWSGLAVEPQRQFAEDYRRYRPRTKFLPFFVSDASNETARLYVVKRAPMIASSSASFVKQFAPPDEVREVPTITITDLLTAERISHVDFVSIDVELHEPEALRGFDIKRFKPALVCIEALLPVRQQILDYFARNGYVLVGKYLWVDQEDLYFAPLTDEPVPPVPGR